MLESPTEGQQDSTYQVVGCVLHSNILLEKVSLHKNIFIYVTIFPILVKIKSKLTPIGEKNNAKTSLFAFCLWAKGLFMDYRNIRFQ